MPDRVRHDGKQRFACVGRTGFRWLRRAQPRLDTLGLRRAMSGLETTHSTPSAYQGEIGASEIWRDRTALAAGYGGGAVA